MYKLNPRFYGSEVTMPKALKKQFGVWVTLSPGSSQKLLKALYEAGHPAVIKNERSDNSK
jgi:hypothetical protein